ncbi:unnamed protein product [Arabis nemorensis]|uniref:Uncharacterized protein n=1 Tax=Arabis nemorensis TaxID=586526 RepID=A0A565AML9_9BRAS|nr:unnamed protein product [Arabis nemorensis]
MSLPPVLFTSSLIPATDASPSSKARGKQIRVEKIDQISKFHDDVLLKILSNLCTEDAIKTSVLSQRWKNVWKRVPCLIFDMKKAPFFRKRAQHELTAEVITKVIQDHNGYLECCKIQHFLDQCEDGTLETWIQSLTQVKHTKRLALINIHRGNRMRGTPSVLQLSPNIFSHPSLICLFLFGYYLESAHAFNNCHNLTTLKLDKICVEVGVFNTVISSCPSLKVLLLDITWYSQKGSLRIHHKNLKLLGLTCTHIDGVDVSTPLLDILAIQCNSVTKSNFLLGAPRLLGFKKSYSLLVESARPHIYYNVSSDAQEIKNVLHELVVSGNTSFRTFEFKTLAVNVDLMNPQEVYMLKEVCDVWSTKMQNLEIFFKHNNIQKEKGESSVGRSQEKKSKERNFFIISAGFGVRTVWMYNLSDFNKEEFALASLLVTQRTVTCKLMIETSSIPANKKLKIEAEVAKLMELPKGNKELIIKCF